jgi:hypothetical protein
MINKLKSFKDIDPALPDELTDSGIGKRIKIVKIPKPPTTEQINNKINNTIPKV